MKLTTEQNKSYEALKAVLDKKFGSGALTILGGKEVSDIERISTGTASIDEAIGGGIPRRRVTEILGPESSGKTTLFLHVIAQAQKAGDVCAFIDAEHALDLNYAKALGVDVDNLILNQPNSAEEALDILDALVESKLVTVIVVDSVAQLVPKVELEGEMGDHSMGVLARLMGKALRKITPGMNKNNVTVLFINQIRMKLGVMFGSPETTPGGNALKFAASLRMDIRKNGQIKDGEDIVASETTIKVIKNKTAPPYKVTQFQIEFGKGINQELDLLRMGVETKVVTKGGAWYSYKDQRLGQGEANAVDTLRTLPDLADRIKAEIKALSTNKVLPERQEHNPETGELV